MILSCVRETESAHHISQNAFNSSLSHIVRQESCQNWTVQAIFETGLYNSSFLHGFLYLEAFHYLTLLL